LLSVLVFTMIYLLQLFNIGLITGHIIQNNHIMDLYKNQFLNSERLRKLYKLYFIFTIITFAGFTWMNFTSSAENCYIKFLFTIPLVILSSFHYIKCISTKIDPFDQYESQLLIPANYSNIHSPAMTYDETANSNIEQLAPPSQYYNHNNELHPMIKHSQGYYKSEDVSPITTNINNRSSSIGSLLKKDRNLSAPILGTLLGAETVLAQSTNQFSSSSSLIPLHLFIATIISISFILSQWCYTIAIFKSNVYTPIRHYMFTSIINLVISITLIILTEFKLNGIAMIQFEDGLSSIGITICNYTISIMLLSQSCFTIVCLLNGQSKQHRDSLQVVEVYNSIPSPDSR